MHINSTCIAIHKYISSYMWEHRYKYYDISNILKWYNGIDNLIIDSVSDQIDSLFEMKLVYFVRATPPPSLQALTVLTRILCHPSPFYIFAQIPEIFENWNLQKKYLLKFVQKYAFSKCYSTTFSCSMYTAWWRICFPIAHSHMLLI